MFATFLVHFINMAQIGHICCWGLHALKSRCQHRSRGPNNYLTGFMLRSALWKQLPPKNKKKKNNNNRAVDKAKKNIAAKGSSPRQTPRSATRHKSERANPQPPLSLALLPTYFLLLFLSPSFVFSLAKRHPTL